MAKKKKEYTDEEVKWLLFYGEPKRDSKIKLDDEGRIDHAIMIMFELLEEQTVFNKKEVERIFWERIKSLANRNEIKK